VDVAERPAGCLKEVKRGQQRTKSWDVLFDKKIGTRLMVGIEDRLQGDQGDRRGSSDSAPVYDFLIGAIDQRREDKLHVEGAGKIMEEVANEVVVQWVPGERAAAIGHGHHDEVVGLRQRQA